MMKQLAALAVLDSIAPVSCESWNSLCPGCRTSGTTKTRGTGTRLCK
jgi:hypothetical protein